MSLPRHFFQAAETAPIKRPRQQTTASGLSLFANTPKPSTPVAIADMDDETLESAAIVAAMTHRQTCSREAYDRLAAINAERRRRGTGR